MGAEGTAQHESATRHYGVYHLLNAVGDVGLDIGERFLHKAASVLWGMLCRGEAHHQLHQHRVLGKAVDEIEGQLPVWKPLYLFQHVKAVADAQNAVEHRYVFSVIISKPLHKIPPFSN